MRSLISRCLIRKQHAVTGMQHQCCLLIVLFVVSAVGQLSDPIAADHQIKTHKNKYLSREATQDYGAQLR